MTNILNSFTQSYNVLPGASRPHFMELKLPFTVVQVFIIWFLLILNKIFLNFDSFFPEDKIEGESGLYYSDCARKDASAHGRDDEAAKKLWELSEKMVGLKEEA